MGDHDGEKTASNTDEIVKPIQPYQARKQYLCPGCESTIESGIGHVVVVPTDMPELRRHWHRGCWYKELRKRGPSSPNSL